MLQVFLTQLYEREPHDRVLVRNPIAENKSKLCIKETVSNIMFIKKKNLHPTLLIGYAMGKHMNISTRTRGATVAPTAKPYLVQTDCGMIC